MTFPYSDEINVDDFDLTPILRPKSTAVIGLSTRNPNHPGNAIFSKNLMEMETKCYGITPRADVVDGHKVYRSLDKLPEIPELAVIAVSARNTYSVIKEAAEMGVKGAVIIGGGFAETGKEGKQRQAELVKLCVDHNMPFVGPNCIGIYGPPIIDTLFLPSERLERPKKGNVAVISQSGGVLIDQFFISCTERDIGISTAISIGNKALVNEAMLLNYFENDPETDVIAFYLEGFHPKTGRKFCELARNSRKDVVVYSGGITAAGKAAAGSHTGSLAADGRVMQGAFKQYSIINPPTELGLKNTLKTFSTLANPFRKYSTMAIRGDKIAVLSVSGGHGVICADLLDKYNLRLTTFTEKQKEDIKFLLNPVASRIAGVDNPIDITGSGTDEDLVNILEYLLNADNVEMILTLLVPQVPQLTMNLGRAIMQIGNKYKKPIISYVPWAQKFDLIRSALEIHHVPCGNTIEETVQMASAVVLKGQGGMRKKFGYQFK